MSKTGTFHVISDDLSGANLSDAKNSKFDAFFKALPKLAQ